MRFETSPQLRLGQQMKLAPRMIQSMEILQLPMLALEERIEQELERNVALETEEPEGDQRELAEARAEAEREDREGERELIADEAQAEADFERLDSMEQSYEEAFANEYTDYTPIRRTSGDDVDAKMEAMANTAARAESLTDQLQRQWALAEVDEEIRDAGSHLINYIDEDGYIRTDLDTIVSQAPAGITAEAIERAWPAIQFWLEPAGIGARDLRECLLLQIDARHREEPAEDWSVERLLVEEHLPDIEANRLPKIAQKSELSLDEIKKALDRLRAFDPRPGRRLAPDSPMLVIPDAVVEYDESTGEYVAGLIDGRIPRLRINDEYAHMARDKALDKSTREFVDRNVREARWLIDAIDQRNHTLLRVIRAVLAHQRDFFDLGPQALKPLPMTQVADQLGVHVATVSRAVNGKWIQTPRGILPLRKFFTAGTETESGEDVSWEAVKQMLREIIEQEDKSDPLGDEQLARMMQEKGVKIARRTVAKYRDQLGIPSARRRKQF